MVIESFGLDSRRHSFLIWWWCAIHPSQVLVEQDEKQVVVHCVFAHLTCSLKILLCLFAKSSRFRQVWVKGPPWVLCLTLYSRDNDSYCIEDNDSTSIEEFLVLVFTSRINLSGHSVGQAIFLCKQIKTCLDDDKTPKFFLIIRVCLDRKRRIWDWNNCVNTIVT